MIAEEVQLRILYIKGRKDDASKHVRVLEPLHYLQKRGHQIWDMESCIANNTFHDVCHEMNVLLISNVDITPNNWDSFQKLADFCKGSKKLIVYDFDDIYYEVPEHNPHKKRTLEWSFIQKVMAQANILTVTGTELYKTLRPHHPKISILPNMIDFMKYKPRPHLSKTFRIGWAGGASHLQDLLLLFSPIRELQKKYEFEFVLFGMFENYDRLAEMIRQKNITADVTKDPFEKDFIQFIKNLEGISYQSKPVVTYEKFPEDLKNLDLDLGLCPIQNTLFNRCRSAIKFYQYAAVHTISLASRIYPYTEEPVLLTDNSDTSWARHLENIISNRTLREEAARTQFDYVFEQRNYEKNIAAWERVYQHAYVRLQS